MIRYLLASAFCLVAAQAHAQVDTTARGMAATALARINLGTNVGTSPTATAPHVPGDATTGLYSAGSGLFDLSASGTQLAEFSSSGLNLVPTTSVLSFAGTPFIHLGAAAQYKESMFLGPRSGNNLLGLNFSTNGMLGVGPDTLRYYTTSGSETVCEGAYSCEFMVTMNAVTALGEHNEGFNDGAGYDTTVGQDVFRDAVGGFNNSVVGAQSMEDGVDEYGNAVLGAFNLIGSGGGITIGGTPVTGDVIKLTFSTSNPNVVINNPGYVSTTVTAGETTAQIASALATAITNFNITANVCNPATLICDGNTTLTESGVKVEANAGAYGGVGASSIRLHFPGGSSTNGITASLAGGVLTVTGAGAGLPLYPGGVVTLSGTGTALSTYTMITGFGTGSGGTGTYNTNTTQTVSSETMNVNYGWGLNVAFSCTGTCTETGTVLNPTNIYDNVAIGQIVYPAEFAGTVAYNVLIGPQVAEYASGSLMSDIVIGSNSFQSPTNDSHVICIGSNICNNMASGSGASENLVIGDRAATAISTGLNETVVGSGQQNDNCITTGSLNMELGAGACVPYPTASNQFSIANSIFATGASFRGAGVSPARVGIGTMAPNAAFTIGNAGGGIDDGHIGFLPSTFLTASALSGCGTSPSISATAGDAHGTITEGTTATGCVMTFATAYATAPDCVLSSPSGNAFTSYSVSTTALTIVNASASGDKFTYVCEQ